MIERILDLMNKNNINAAALSREISLSNGLITQWKKGQQKPSTDAIIKLATYFGVTTDYLLLGKENKTDLSNENYAPLASSELSNDEIELLNVYRKLDARGKHIVHASSYDELDRVDSVKPLETLIQDVG